MTVKNKYGIAIYIKLQILSFSTLLHHNIIIDGINIIGAAHTRAPISGLIYFTIYVIDDSNIPPTIKLINTSVLNVFI